ncbi:MAG: hypothetical protein WB615_01060 [Candidatus Tumulicola sp.]
MPKRVMILLAAVSFAVAIPACHSSSGTVTPTPVPSLTPNPSLSTATISVTRLATPAADVSVEESTPKSSSSPRPGTPFATQRTGHAGMTKFKNLKPTQTYCWVAILGKNQTSSACAGWEIWQYQPISLGT